MHRTSSVLARITSYLYACIVYKLHDTRDTPYDPYLMNPNLNPNDTRGAPYDPYLMNPNLNPNDTRGTPYDPYLMNPDLNPNDTRGTPYDPYLMNPNLNPNAIHILLTKTTAARNGAALSYHSLRGLCFLAVVFTATIAVQMI